jgi:hypothetical protein
MSRVRFETLRTLNFPLGGPVIGFRLLFSTLAAICLLAAVTVANADPISDLRSLSVFKDADLNKLAGGDVLAARGPAMSLARGLSVQTAYVVRAPVRTTVSLQQQWNPLRHPELKIYAQEDVSGRGNPAEFQGLASVRSSSSVKAFADATLRLPQDASKLQLSSSEVKLFTPGGSTESAMPASVVAFWSRVLAGRAQSFASSGFSGQPPYETSGSPVRVATEISRLVQESGNVRTQFSPVISASPIGGGRGSAVSQTWQMFDADGMAAVSLSASYGRPVGDGWQTADLLYYASGAVYAVVTFYQLWPVKVENQDATLIWRVDMTSASELGELRGVERLGSGAAMMRAIQRDVKAFLHDTPRGR